MLINDKETEMSAEEKEQEETARAAQTKREEELEQRARDAELKEARASAALEESRRSIEKMGNTAAAPAGVTESQWQQIEAENPGKTREEIVRDFQKLNAAVDVRLKPLAEETRAATERAAKAEARAAALETRTGVRDVEREFYEKNPALRNHQKDVQEVLESYPDHDAVDATTHKKRLAVALDVVKGRVKEKMTTRRGQTDESSRLDVEGDGKNEEQVSEFDPEDLPKGSARLMADVHDNLGRDSSVLRNPDESLKYYEKNRRKSAKGDYGVTLDTAKEDRENALRRN